MDRKMVNFIKEQYPPGTRIRLNAMDDPYAPILPGTEGEVDFVDDEGQIFMKWNNGRTLPLAPGKDSFTVLPPKLTSLKLYILGLTTDGEGYMKYAGNELEYTLSDLSVHISNNAIASGRSEGYLATATLHLEVPTRFAGRVLPPVSLNLQVQAKYIPKF